MKKEILIGILVVIVLGLVVALMIKPKAPVPQQALDANGQVAEEIAEPQLPTLSLEEANRTIKSEYKDDVMFQQCLAETVEGCLSQVITTKIYETKDLSLCDDYITDQQKESCKVSNVTIIARESKDVDQCNVLEEAYKDSCMSEVALIVAIEEQNIGKCDVLNDVYRENCRQNVALTLAQQTADAKWCNDLPEEQKEMCVQEVEFYKEDLRLQAEQEALINAEAEEAANAQPLPEEDVDDVTIEEEIEPIEPLEDGAPVI